MDHPATNPEIFVTDKRAPVEGGQPFKLVSDYQPAGDQPEAIEELSQGLINGERSMEK